MIINTTFWHQIPRPIIALAPMFDVTNVAFRQMIAQTAPADVYFTEFVSAEALNSRGYHAVIKMLDYTENQRPIVAQIWGHTLTHLEAAARIIADLGFDGIDLNMGCPQKSVLKHGVCSALINDHPRAADIIAATKAGAGHLPVSVKTRIGFAEIQTEEWIGFLLTQDLPVISIHGRTVADMSRVPANWDEIAKAVHLRDQINKETLIIGNGDVMNYWEGRARVDQTGVDGVMIGRGLFQDIYALEKSPSPETKTNPTQTQRLQLLRQHLALHTHHFNSGRHFALFKRLLKIYIREFDHAAQLRDQLINAPSPNHILDILTTFETTYPDPLLSHTEGSAIC
ncbi:MAG TPA: tRNA-dihydrouridine synthase [Anaerolineae bacterium]|nr:tRNA-dihydrouridine synthase [Anaerolineae bacterium]